MANHRRTAKKIRTPGAYGSTGLAGIDALEVACSAGSLVKIPSASSCVLLRARALIDAYSASFKTTLWEHYAMTLRSIEA